MARLEKEERGREGDIKNLSIIISTVDIVYFFLEAKMGRVIALGISNGVMRGRSARSTQWAAWTCTTWHMAFSLGLFRTIPPPFFFALSVLG